MGAEVAATEVAEVLVEVPKYTRMPRLKPTPTKETMKDKKGKVAYYTSERIAKTKPTKAHCPGERQGYKPKEDIEDIPMDDEDVGVEIEEVEAQGADPITRLLEYVPPCKAKSNVPKDTDESKTPLKTPLLPDEINFDGMRLARMQILKLEDLDLVKHEKFPHLVTKQLMCHIIETNTGMTALELWMWLRGVDKAGLLNLL